MALEAYRDKFLMDKPVNTDVLVSADSGRTWQPRKVTNWQEHDGAILVANSPATDPEYWFWPKDSPHTADDFQWQWKPVEVMVF